MRSGTSCFDMRFSRHLLRRFWPLWLLWLLILIAAGPLAVGSISRTRELIWYLSELRSTLLHSAAAIVWMSFFMGAAMAMGMLSWLCFPRDCGMVSALPLRRETLYFTAVLTGLVPMLFSDALVFGLLLALYGPLGIETRYFVWWLAMVALANAGFYGFGCFCGTLTGNILILPAVYAVLSCTAAVFEGALHAVFSALLYGYATPPLRAEFLSPPIWLDNHPGTRRVADPDMVRGSIGVYEPTWLAYLAGLCAVGLVLAALAVLILKRRHMETAGEVVAVPVLRPIFRVCMCLGCGFVGAAVAMDLFFTEVYGTKKFVLLLIFLLGFAALGFFIAEMLIRRTLRVFRRGWKQLGLLCACLAVFAVLTELDVLGYETRIPDAADIVSIEAPIYDAPRGDGLREPETIAAFLDFQRGLIAHKAQHEADADPRRDGISLSYQLKNGKSYHRYYHIVNDEASRADPDSDLLAWLRVLNLRELRRMRLWADYAPTEVDVREAWVEVIHTDGTHSRSEDVYLTPAEALSLYRTGLLPDAEDGSIGGWRLWEDEQTAAADTNFFVCITLVPREGAERYWPSIGLTVHKDSVRTLQWLRENLNLEPTE